MNIQRDETNFSKTTQDNQVLACIEKLSKHPNMVNIKKRMETTSNEFCFKYEERKKFFTEIQNLNYRKASQQNDISVKILKESSDICSYILHHNFNNCLFSDKFPKYLKKADITPVFEKDEIFLKTSYRPVSIFSRASKIYEWCLYDHGTIIRTGITCREPLVICTTQLAGGLLVKKLKYFEIMLNIF